MVSKVWKWYKRHENAVDAILDMACAAVPGACFVKGALKLALAQLQDSREAEQEDKVQEMEKVLEEVQPVIRDVVEEIEELESFQKAKKEEEKRKAIEESPRVKEEVEKILPEVVQSLVRSMPKMGQTRILNRKYELLERIGGGGQGIVYRGRHLKAKTAVAIKLLPRELSEDYTAIEGLRLEFQHLVQSLRHPNIVQYWDMDEDEESGQYFLVMDLVEGKNLRRIIMGQRKRPMAQKEVGQWLMPVAMALDFAHENKIVHRDVKPENILIRETDGKVFLTDFGLSAEIHSSLSCKGKMTETISGTLPYMAPEQYEGRPAVATTDNWALGVMAYEMLAGYHPFQGTSFEHYMRLVCGIPLAEIDEMPEATWQVLEKMLQKDKKYRPTHAEEWVKDLLQGNHSPVASSAPRPEERAARKVSPIPSQASEEDAFLMEQKKKLESLRQEVETERKKKEAIQREIEEERQKAEKRAEERKREEESKKKAEKEKARLAEELRRQEEEKRRISEERKKEEARLAEIRRKEQEQKESYGLPCGIWNQCQYSHQGEKILDMTTSAWVNLAVSEQQKYAAQYQKGYASAKGLEVEKTVSKSGATFVFRLIPPGRFWMGSPENEPGRSSDEKRHRVVITKPYYMGKYEVTQGQWKAVTGKNPSYFQKAGLEAPVEQVSWNDCQDFGSKVKMQLPTEAQWEYACRGGVTRAYSFGEDAGSLGEYAWWDNNSSSTTHPVGKKSPNAWGLYDMIGNVWEWCQDKANWNDKCETDTYTNDIMDPVCQNGSRFVDRGGSWNGGARDCRPACRYCYSAAYRGCVLGFRCASPAEGG